MREGAKQALLSLLASQDFVVVKSAANCIAAVGVIEVPQGMWPDLISIMV